MSVKRQIGITGLVFISLTAAHRLIFPQVAQGCYEKVEHCLNVRRCDYNVEPLVQCLNLSSPQLAFRTFVRSDPEQYLPALDPRKFGIVVSAEWAAILTSLFLFAWAVYIACARRVRAGTAKA